MSRVLSTRKSRENLLKAIGVIAALAIIAYGVYGLNVMYTLMSHHYPKPEKTVFNIFSLYAGTTVLVCALIGAAYVIVNGVKAWLDSGK